MRSLMLVIVMGLFTASAFAECTLAFNKPRGGAMAVSYVSNRTYHQLLEILADKGYTVLTKEELQDQTPEYTLNIKGYHGYGCGTGLTFRDYLTVPAYNFIQFNGLEGLNMSFEKSFSAPIGVKLTAKRHLMKTVQALPDCSNN